MARKIAELLIKLGADTLGVTKMSADVRKQLNSLQKDLTGFGNSWSLYVTAPLTAAAGVAVKAADVQLKNEKRLLTALRGREDIQQRLIKQAGELQSRSLFGDEEIIGQQAFLASLGLTEQQINDTIEAAAQLSSATGMTLDSAVKNLAKTYGGLSGELGESIPKLKELTTEQMKNGEAVKFILENYKGYAETLAKTGTGPLKQLWMAIGDLAEEFGKVLMPMVQAAARMLKDFAAWLQGLSPAAKTSIVVIGGVVAALGPLSVALGSAVKLLPMLKIGLAAITGPVGLVTAAILGAASALAIFKANSDAIVNERISEQAQKYISSGKSIDELKQMREEALAKNLEYYGKQKQARDATNPLKAGSLPYFVASYRENRKNMFVYGAQTQYYYEKVKALDEAISVLSQTADTTGLTVEDFTKTVEDSFKVIQGSNTEIEKSTGLIGQLEQKIKELETAKREATSTMEIHNLTLEIATLRDELSKLQQIGAAESIAGDTGNLFGKGGISPLAFDPDAINPPESDWSEARQNFAANLSNFASEARAQTMDVAASIRGFLSDVATAIGEGLGNIFTGDGTFDDMLNGIVSAMGNFLKSLGEQLIALGTMMVAIRAAVNASWLTPWTAIAVGVAAVALGTAMINAFNKRAEGGVALAEGGLAYGPTMALVGDNRGAGSDPEVIAPLSKLRQYGLGHQTIEFVGGTFRLSGSDLVLAISREQAKINYVNALA